MVSSSVNFDASYMDLKLCTGLHSFQIDTEVTPVAELRGHEDAVQAVMFDPNGKYMVSGSSDSTFRVWGDYEKTPPPEYVSTL